MDFIITEHFAEDAMIRTIQTIIRFGSETHNA